MESNQSLGGLASPRLSHSATPPLVNNDEEVMMIPVVDGSVLGLELLAAGGYARTGSRTVVEGR